MYLPPLRASGCYPHVQTVPRDVDYLRKTRMILEGKRSAVSLIKGAFRLWRFLAGVFLTYTLPSDLSGGCVVWFRSVNMLNCPPRPTIFFLVCCCQSQSLLFFSILSFSRGHIDLLGHLFRATIFSLFGNYLLSQGPPYITGEVSLTTPFL